MSEEFRKSSTDTNKENNEPRPDITQIIDAIVAVCLGKKKPVEAFRDCADVYKDECFAFAKDKACQFLEEQLRKSKEEKIRQLSENEFADRLIGSMLGIKDVIKAYYDKTINIDELISALADTGIKEVAIETVEALGVPEKMGVEEMLLQSISMVNRIRRYSNPVLSISCNSFFIFCAIPKICGLRKMFILTTFKFILNCSYANANNFCYFISFIYQSPR